jgi:hypothetical protein
MEGFTRGLRRHIKQYDAIQGSESADHPREIAPTPTLAVRAAQVITTEMVQHYTKIKRNTRLQTTIPRLTQQHRKSSNTPPVTQQKHHNSE